MAGKRERAQRNEEQQREKKGQLASSPQDETLTAAL
jgi:hypothetical protein